MIALTRARVALGVAAVLLIAAVPASASAGPSSDHPVQYGYPAWLAGLGEYLNNDDRPPVGANDWSCKPSAEHANPVVLAHGALAKMAVNWITMSPLLANEGYCVFALTYGIPEDSPEALENIGGRALMEDSAAELATFVDEVLAATGADEVDLVGHSEGTLVSGYYTKILDGADSVANIVSLTPLWDGTEAVDFERYGPLGELFADLTDEDFPARTQFLPGSDFITDLNSGGTPAAPDVTYTNILTRYDLAVDPYTSGLMDAPNATNIVVQDVCGLDLAGHAMAAYNPNVTQMVLNALDPDSAAPVHCQVMPPSV